MKQLIQSFQSKYTPLQQLLIIGFIIRLFSVIFSKGFGWHDDHFLIIESAQNWADGLDNHWVASKEHPDVQPQGHSFFYIGIHFYIFKVCGWLHIYDPQTKMLLVRFLHALWSLLLIKYSYKIAEQYSNKKVAWYVGLFMTLYWFMPFMSVRNLVEFVCVPPCLIAVYQLKKENLTWRNFLLAGVWLGIAFSIRFQTLFIVAGVGIALLIYKTSIKNIIALAISFLIVVLLTQGLVDFIIWKKPFAEFLAYVDYNMANAGVYGTDNWHMYFDLIFGLLIPPLSFLLFAGYFYSWKKVPLLFWPVLFYLAFHTYFPNKQERFVMTILPLMIISGTIGMFMLYEKYKNNINKKLFVFCKNFVIVLNLILLPVLTVSYSKRHRVEAMTYLYEKNDSNNFFVEDSNKENDFLIPPLYYYGKWPSTCGITKTFTADSALAYYNKLEPQMKPTYIIFWQAENIKARVDSTKKRFPSLIYETTIEPSFIDKTLFWLNPYNDNQTAFIYRFPENTWH
jgi:hypothetical protein